MDRFGAVLLNVWREAGRHIEMRESAANFARLLAEHLPLSHLLVRRIETTHSALETIAVGQAADAPRPIVAKTLLNGARLKRLMAWGREGTVLHAVNGAKTGDLAAVVPADVAEDAIAGPLQGPEKPSGVLVLVAAHQKSFRPVHLQMAEAL